MKKTRILSIDLLRGVVMIIMALDHIRDYFHADAFLYDPADLSRTNVPLFFTRWITNFCAPVFVMLAGTSAFLAGQRRSRKDLSIFLFSRGLWMVFLELVVVNFAWFFNIHFSFVIFAVIWALGVSMIALSVLIHLPTKWILITGVVLVAGHNLLDHVHVPGNGLKAIGWAFLHERKSFHRGNWDMQAVYPLLPWIGLMALGYCLGSLYTPDVDGVKRRRLLLRLGSGVLLLFILLRLTNGYGDLVPWSRQATPVFSFLSFINVTKYPPSLDYVLLMIGPALLFLALTEKPLNRLTRIISVYGRVPFFYYMIHIFLIHLAALIAAAMSGYPWTAMTGFRTWVDFDPRLQGYGFSLWVVYLVWVCLIVLLYPLCKRYDRYKSEHKEKWWLSYL
jgi:uncharacterized membrane protein